MGLIENELKEISQMHRDLKNKKITPDLVNAHIGLFSQTEKRLKLMLQVQTNATKFNKSILNRAVNSNLIGDGQAVEIDQIDREKEKVRCPLKDNSLIERQECLDLSGTNTNIDACSKCDNCNTTKDVLL